jgi:hypothetical protein
MIGDLLIPDAEQLVSNYLRATAEVYDLVGVDGDGNKRIYTVIPNDPTFPLVKVVRIGGGPTTSRPLYHDRALLQIDAYGGNKKFAHTLSAMVLAALADAAFVGVHETDDEPLGVVSGVEFGAVQRWHPDPDYSPAKPRYLSDLAVHTHPVPGQAS